MVQRTVTVFIDDLTDTEGEDIATHTFSLDGVSYEIDLNPDSHQLLLDALAPFLKVGRKSGSAPRRRGSSKRADGPDPIKVREWAKSQGIEVNARGRVPRDVIEKYEDNH
ncbi:histone-like nucleoid-structuring protein Lsr2 [Streptomyces xylophagus]|uniref:histone-like nucleoid-structuring protein Lsr2 n=1 Tax=Streptomyces xylophagus TaxID=285514 RepID=UPI0005BCCA48|nr:Lsr2 family protein [Streptomyces xylophagus]